MVSRLQEEGAPWPHTPGRSQWSRPWGPDESHCPSSPGPSGERLAVPTDTPGPLLVPLFSERGCVHPHRRTRSRQPCLLFTELFLLRIMGAGNSSVRVSGAGQRAASRTPCTLGRGSLRFGEPSTGRGPSEHTGGSLTVRERPREGGGGPAGR